ncbi:DUF1559 family PulG-like putative transporter [Schlesneria paludicola]|uniref:DUF1559 family PulG-like putative transporter n=1 Tax=Schlesneria paludicola TaxID=360056 RepID=UPI00029AC151|nr:DUF1559 domain-containing protein [Schlesneria paludicola]
MRSPSHIVHLPIASPVSSKKYPLGLQRRHAFTLVEALLATAISLVLLAVLLPAIQYSRERARTSQCQDHLRQLGFAMSNYAQAFSVFPPAQGMSCNNYPSGDCQMTMNWCISLLPYLDNADTYNCYDQLAPFTDPSNAKAIARSIPSLICPSTPRSSNLTSMEMTSMSISNVVNSDPYEASGNFIPYGLPASATGGSADYVISSGVKASLMRLMFSSDSSVIARLTIDGTVRDSWGFGRPSEWMELTNLGYSSGGTTSIATITDGTSNTTMLFELAGRNTVYHAGFRNLLNGPSNAPMFDLLEIENQLAFGGGMWADPANGDYFVGGRVNRDGSGQHCGPYLVNKSNMRSSAAGGGSYYYGYGCGPYGFHRGGAQVLMCDGSVRMFSENMDGVTLCTLVGAQDALDPGGL